MNNNDIIENFTAITGASTDEAVQFMSCCDFDLESAVQLYFASHGGHTLSPDTDERPGSRRARDNNLEDDDDVTALSVRSDVVQPPGTSTQVRRMFEDDDSDDLGIMGSSDMLFMDTNHQEGDTGGPPKGIYSISESEFFPPEIQNHFNIIPGCSLPSYGYEGRYHFSPVSSSETRKQNNNNVLRALDNCCGVACITKRPVLICILEGGNEMDSLFFCRDVLNNEIVQCTLQAYCQCFFQVVNPTSEGLICHAETRLQSSRIANEAGVLNSIRKTNGDMAYRDAQRAINISELMAMYHLEHEIHRPICFMIHPLTRARVWPIQGSLHKYKQDIQKSHPPSFYDTQSIVCEIIEHATKISKSAFSHDADDFFITEVPDDSPTRGPDHRNSSSAPNGARPLPYSNSSEGKATTNGSRVVENIDCSESNVESFDDCVANDKRDEPNGMSTETGSTIQLDSHLYFDETPGAKKPDGLKIIRIRTPTGVINLPCLPSMPLYHLFLFAASHIHKKKSNISEKKEEKDEGQQQQSVSLYSFIESSSLVNFSSTVQFLSGFPPKAMEIGSDALSKTLGECSTIRNGDMITPHSSS